MRALRFVWLFILFPFVACLRLDRRRRDRIVSCGPRQVDLWLLSTEKRAGRSFIVDTTKFQVKNYLHTIYKYIYKILHSFKRCILCEHNNLKKIVKVWVVDLL